jgi:hypothetical protein
MVPDDLVEITAAADAVTIQGARRTWETARAATSDTTNRAEADLSAPRGRVASRPDKCAIQDHTQAEDTAACA